LPLTNCWHYSDRSKASSCFGTCLSWPQNLTLQTL